MSRRSSFLLPAMIMATAAIAHAQESRLQDPRALDAAVQGAKSADTATQPPKVRNALPSRVGHLSALDGEVALKIDGEDVPSDAERTFPITGGATVATMRDSRAAIEFGDTLVALDGRTSLVIETLDDDRVILSLDTGSIDVRVHDLAAGERFSVATPLFNATFEQPGAYRINVDPSGVMRIDIFDGLAKVETRAGWHDFTADQALEMDGDRAFAAQARVALLEDWVERDEARRAASAAARYVSTDIPGAADLDAAGSWQSSSEYGPLWVPKVPADWAPYQNGHWSWVRPWGWTWIDSAAWGFAPSHYGRWIYAQGHWAWSPGKRLRHPIYVPAVVGFDGVDPARFASPRQPPVRWVALGPGEIYRAPFSEDDDYLRKVNAGSVNAETLARASWPTDEWPTFMNIDHVRLGFANASTTSRFAAQPRRREDEVLDRQAVPVKTEVPEDGLDSQGRMILRLPMNEARRLNLVPGAGPPRTYDTPPHDEPAYDASAHDASAYGARAYDARAIEQNSEQNHLTHPELADRGGLVDPLRDGPARPPVAAEPLAAAPGHAAPLSRPVLAERKKPPAKTGATTNASQGQAQPQKHDPPRAPTADAAADDGAGK